MNNDKTVIHHLWWLHKFLSSHFGKMEYKDVIYTELDTNTCKEVDELVAHIKANY